jgi:hypothetical protein
MQQPFRPYRCSNEKAVWMSLSLIFPSAAITLPFRAEM